MIPGGISLNIQNRKRNEKITAIILIGRRKAVTVMLDGVKGIAAD